MSFYLCNPHATVRPVADGLGSLADRTMRLPMDNPIFIKLQDMIEQAPKSPYW